MERAVVRFGLDGNFARISELDGVANKIDQHLRQASAVTMAWWQFRGHLDFEGQLFVSRQRLQRAANGLGNVLNAVIRKFEFELTGLDLRQIKHVIDESEQVLAVGLKSFEYSKHLLRRLTVSAVRHQFGVAQDGVERGAQLMAHIRQELRLVLARLFKLPTLFLDFVKEPRILNGDDRLGGEVRDQRYLFVGKWPNLLAIDVEGANDRAFLQHWHGDQRMYTSSFHRGHCQRTAVDVGLILFKIDHLNWLASLKCACRWRIR